MTLDSNVINHIIHYVVDGVVTIVVALIHKKGKNDIGLMKQELEYHKEGMQRLQTSLNQILDSLINRKGK